MQLISWHLFTPMWVFSVRILSALMCGENADKNEVRKNVAIIHWLSMSRTKSQADRNRYMETCLVWKLEGSSTAVDETEIVRKLHAFDMLSMHGNSACESIATLGYTSCIFLDCDWWILRASSLTTKLRTRLAAIIAESYNSAHR